MKLLLKTMLGTFLFVFFISSYMQIKIVEETKLKALANIKDIKLNIETNIEKIVIDNNESLESLLLTSFNNWEKSKTTYERQGLSFSYLNFNNIEKDSEVYFGLDTYYKRLKEVENMQKVAIYISRLHKVDLKLSEEIVYNSYLQGNKHNVEPLLVLSVIAVESTYKPTVLSSAGAIGLTQVIPRFHQEKIDKLNEDSELWSVSGNIQVGTNVLKDYLKLAKGNTTKALQMYNGSLNDETLFYSSKVFHKLNGFKNILKQNISVS